MADDGKAQNQKLVMTIISHPTQVHFACYLFRKLGIRGFFIAQKSIVKPFFLTVCVLEEKKS